MNVRYPARRSSVTPPALPLGTSDRPLNGPLTRRQRCHGAAAMTTSGRLTDDATGRLTT